ncbi:MAG: glycosyltransferase, partial [bacterium]
IDSFKLLKIIKANKQLCFTHEAGIIGLLLKKTTGTGYWLDYQGSLHKEMSKQHPIFSLFLPIRLFSFVEKKIEDEAEAVIYNSSESYANSAKTAKYLIEDDSSVYDGYTEPQMKREKNIFNILWVGVMTPVQNIDEFVLLSERLLSKYDNLRITIAGFPVKQKYRDRLKSFSERAVFTGKVDYEKLPAMVMSSDLCVSTKGESSEGNAKLHLFKRFATKIIALRTKSSQEILDSGSLADNLSELEIKIKEIIENANSASA